MKQINASATIDSCLKDGRWVVHVWSEELGLGKDYVIDAPSEDRAAFMAIDRFVAEHQDATD